MYDKILRDLRENVQYRVAAGEAPREIQPHHQTKTAAQFAVDAIVFWRACSRLRQMHQGSKQNLISNIYLL